jgi:hypothetical protein
VFTATKVAQVIRQVIGDPMEVPYDDVEVRDGPMSTHQLTSEDLILDKEELHDENSVIFRVADLKPKQDKKPTGVPEGRVTRQAEISDARQPPPPPRRASTPEIGPPRTPTPVAGTPRAPTPAAGMQRAQSKPRAANEETRQVSNPAPPSGSSEDSGLLEFKTPPPPVAAWKPRNTDSTLPDSPDLDNVGESTMISGAPNVGGFLMDVAGEDGVDATVVSEGPPIAPDEHDEDGETLMGARPDSEEDGATVQRDFRDAAKPRVASKRGPAPPALAAKIHAPRSQRDPKAARIAQDAARWCAGGAAERAAGDRRFEPERGDACAAAASARNTAGLAR